MSDNPYQSPQHDSVAPVAATEGEKFAGCPSCGNVYATRVSFTFWGGALGPWLLSHVKCGQCGTSYNGRTGKSNTVPIIIYTVITFAIVFGILFVIGG